MSLFFLKFFIMRTLLCKFQNKFKEKGFIVTFGINLALTKIKSRTMVLKYILIPFIGFIGCVNSNPKKSVANAGNIEMKISQPRRGAFRTVEGNKIIRTVDASQLPLNIGEEFTNENQQFVLVIKNVKKSSISAKISTNDKARNIRINQIIMPNNLTDGPFSNNLNYKTSKKGTYKIVIGKNSMADGQLTGNFSVSVE